MGLDENGDIAQDGLTLSRDVKSLDLTVTD